MAPVVPRLPVKEGASWKSVPDSKLEVSQLTKDKKKKANQKDTEVAVNKDAKKRRVENENEEESLFELNDASSQRLSDFDSFSDANDLINNDNTDLDRTDDVKKSKQRKLDPFEEEVLILNKEDISLEEKKIKVGTLCSAAIEFPEKNLSYIRALIRWVIHHRTSSSKREEHLQLIKLISVSVLAVFQDIMPGYVVRQNQEVTKLSKDVQERQTYESSLLSIYRLYLKQILAFIDSSEEDDDEGLLKKCSIRILFKLLESAHHFNFSLDLADAIIRILIPRRSESQTKESPYASLAANCLKHVFQIDSNGYLTWFVTTRLSDAIQKASYRAPLKVLEALLDIQVCHLAPAGRDDVDKGGMDKKYMNKKEKRILNRKQKKEASHISKKNKKTRKEMAEWNKELDEAEAQVSIDRLTHWRRQSLRYLFRIYVGVLKKEDLIGRPAVAFAIVQGVFRLSHMLSEDILNDLIRLLSENISKWVRKGLLQVAFKASSCIFKMREEQAGSLVTGLTLDSKSVAVIQMDQTSTYQAIYQALTAIPSHLGYHLYDFNLHPSRLAIVQNSLDRRSKGGKKNPPSIFELWKPASNSPTSDVEPFDFFNLKECLHFLLLHERHQTLVRPAAFLHRLLWVVFSLPPPAMVSILEIMSSVFAKLPRLIRPLLNPKADLEDSSMDLMACDPASRGTYLPDTSDPDFANPLNFSMRPLLEHIQKIHPDGHVKQSVKELLALFKVNVRPN